MGKNFRPWKPWEIWPDSMLWAYTSGLHLPCGTGVWTGFQELMEINQERSRIFAAAEINVSVACDDMICFLPNTYHCSWPLSVLLKRGCYLVLIDCLNNFHLSLPASFHIQLGEEKSSKLKYTIDTNLWIQQRWLDSIQSQKGWEADHGNHSALVYLCWKASHFTSFSSRSTCKKFRAGPCDG